MPAPFDAITLLMAKLEFPVPPFTTGNIPVVIFAASRFGICAAVNPVSNDPSTAGNCADAFNLTI